MPRSLNISVESRPSMARMAALITINNNGIMMGKLKTGINKLLLPALEAMAESMVKVLAKPRQPNKVTAKYRPKDSIGSPINKIKVAKHKQARTRFNMEL